MKNKFVSFLLLSLLLLLGSYSFASVPNETKPTNSTSHFSNMPTKEIDSAFYKSNMVELDSIYGQNKIILPKYQLQILIALSYFPELKAVKIEFAYKKIKTT